MDYHETLKNYQNSFENQYLGNHAKQACQVKPKVRPKIEKRLSNYRKNYFNITNFFVRTNPEALIVYRYKPLATGLPRSSLPFQTMLWLPAT